MARKNMPAEGFGEWHDAHTFLKLFEEGVAQLTRIAHAIEHQQLTQTTLNKVLRGLRANTQGIIDAQSTNPTSATLQKGEQNIMATAQDLIDEVAKQTTTVASLKTYTAGLRKALADAIAANGGVINQAQLDAVMANMTKNDQDMADAMVENVPPVGP
jgi:hypothetical protein